MFAWQGFSLPLDDNWHPDVLTGTAREGYLQLTDGTDLFVQLRWRTCKRPVSLNKQVQQYLQKLEAGFRKRKHAFQSTFQCERLRVSFEWHSQQKGYGIVDWDSNSNRVYMLELSGPKRDSLKRLARELHMGIGFATDDLWEWRLLGLDLRLPKQVLLSESKLLSGHIQLEFKARNWKLKAQRWAFASQLLGGRQLKDWAEGATRMKVRNESPNCVELCSERRKFVPHRSAVVKLFPQSNKLVLISGKHPSSQRLEPSWIL